MCIRDSIGTKISVLWPSKYAKIRFLPGLCPGPRWGSSRRSPRLLSRLERGHPSPYPTPLGTDPPSAFAMRPPQKSSQIYAYGLMCIALLSFLFVNCSVTTTTTTTNDENSDMFNDTNYNTAPCVRCLATLWQHLKSTAVKDKVMRISHRCLQVIMLFHDQMLL